MSASAHSSHMTGIDPLTSSTRSEREDRQDVMPRSGMSWVGIGACNNNCEILLAFDAVRDRRCRCRAILVIQPAPQLLAGFSVVGRDLAGYRRGSVEIAVWGP